MNVPLDRFPVFLRKGTVLPLQVRQPSLWGDGQSADALTLLVVGVPTTSGSRNVYSWPHVSQWSSDTTTLRQSVTVGWTRQGSVVHLAASATDHPIQWVFHGVDFVTAVSLINESVEKDEMTLAEVTNDPQRCGLKLRVEGKGFCRSPTGQLWLRTGSSANGSLVRLTLASDSNNL